MRRNWVVMAVASVAASVCLAGAARADTDDNDAAYLETLKLNGLGCGESAIECPSGDASMIAVGHAICRQLKGGNSARSVGTQIVRSRPGLQPEQAARLVIAAEAAYCP